MLLATSFLYSGLLLISSLSQMCYDGVGSQNEDMVGYVLKRVGGKGVFGT